MTNTTPDTAASVLRADRMSYEAWKAVQQRRWEDSGNTYWFNERKTARSRNRGAQPPADAFTGPYWMAKKWMTEEAIWWFEVDGNPRYTFSDWQDMRRIERAEEAARLIDEANGAALASLAYWRDLTDRRGELIMQARDGGATWAAIVEATGLSRAQCHELARKWAHPVTDAPDGDTPEDAEARRYGYADAAAMQAAAETPF